jgi:G patch domain/KOW motif-containing protein
LADADGNIKSVRRNGEALTPLSKVGLHEGSLVGIVQGPHDGLYARVLKIFSTTGQLLVRLESSDEEVTVSKDDVTQVDEKRLNQDHPALLFAEKTKAQESKKDTKKDKVSEDKKTVPKAKEPTRRDKESKSWMFPNLVVRIISKSFSAGKYYLKKGTIVDVIDMERCTLQLLENKKQLLEGTYLRFITNT